MNAVLAFAGCRKGTSLWLYPYRRWLVLALHRLLWCSNFDRCAFLALLRMNAKLDDLLHARGYEPADADWSIPRRLSNASKRSPVLWSDGRPEVLASQSLFGCICNLMRYCTFGDDMTSRRYISNVKRCLLALLLHDSHQGKRWWKARVT